MRLIAGKTVMELGCGNGRFTKVASQSAKMVYGLDWARSNLFDDSFENVIFVQSDALKADFPKVDVACSGDVLEHFKPDDVPNLIQKLHESAEINFHVIACYDDKHSHLTIQPKEWWLAQFQKLDPAYKLFNDGGEKRDIAIISNLVGAGGA
ncbi:MAG: class I SAM-dependent methyltransferase [Ahrensia sp.]|nr:class I SAM-dependent methyltransferase [Ahrensia sp.]